MNEELSAYEKFPDTKQDLTTDTTKIEKLKYNPDEFEKHIDEPLTSQFWRGVEENHYARFPYF